MATFEQNGDKVRITQGSLVHDYNIRDVEYDHNGVTLVILVNGLKKHFIKYVDITSPSSTSLKDLVDQLNAYSSTQTVITDNSDISGTLEGSELQLKRIEALLCNIVEQNQDIIKYLKKIYNPE